MNKYVVFFPNSMVDPRGFPFHRELPNQRDRWRSRLHSRLQGTGRFRTLDQSE